MAMFNSKLLVYQRIAMISRVEETQKWHHLCVAIKPIMDGINSELTNQYLSFQGLFNEYVTWG